MPPTSPKMSSSGYAERMFGTTAQKDSNPVTPSRVSTRPDSAAADSKEPREVLSPGKLRPSLERSSSSAIHISAVLSPERLRLQTRDHALRFCNPRSTGSHIRLPTAPPQP